MKKQLALAILATGVAGLAAAQRDMPTFEEVDQNQDGMISRTEAAVVEGLEFSVADANQDGYIDREEYEEIAE
ncbi:MAG TPA: hypothetical protein VIN61_12860 [Gammaproteobacteria bacterium]